MTLGEAQQQFAKIVGQLLVWIYQQPGLGVTFGDAYRTPAQAQADVQAGSGIVNSLHCERLAVDLNLFKDGVYHGDTESYRPLGEYFESIGGTWGGRFSKPDGNHFSLAWGGRK